MSDLKTLKDIEEIYSPMKRVYGGEDLISANIIREEAKNWAKKLANEINPPKTPATSLRLKNEGIIDWIVYFFNLEEEK